MPAGPRLVYADGPDGPLPDPTVVAEAAGLPAAGLPAVGLPAAGLPAAEGGGEVVLGWVVRRPEWLGRPGWPVTVLQVGPGTRAAVAGGRARNVPARLSTVPGLLAGRLRPTVAVVGAVADGPRWRFAGSLGWAPTAAEHADAVVIERWDRPVPDAPEVKGRVVAVIDRAEPPDPPPAPRIGPPERAIAAQVAALLPEGATIQWGPGAIGAAVIGALTSPVRVRSGLVTDELVGLAGRGLLAGTAEAAYLWGGEALASFVAAGGVRLRPVEETHDLRRAGSIERFVALNTAVEVGLDGSVNVERAGGSVVAGPGGHPDFALAGSRSPGGLSVIALVSTSRGGASTIVSTPAAVSTPRTDVDLVVTEHGVADLRGADDRQRAARLVAVAAPEFREALAAGSR